MSIQVLPRLRTAPSPGVPWARLSAVRVGIVLWGGLALVDVGRVTTAPSYAELGAVALLVAAASVRMRVGTALSAALVGWLVVNGFVVHRLGVLGFDGTADLARLGLMVGVALLAARVRR